MLLNSFPMRESSRMHTLKKHNIRRSLLLMKSNLKVLMTHARTRNKCSVQNHDLLTYCLPASVSLSRNYTNEFIKLFDDFDEHSHLYPSESTCSNLLSKYWNCDFKLFALFTNLSKKQGLNIPSSFFFCVCLKQWCYIDLLTPIIFHTFMNLYKMYLVDLRGLTCFHT